MVGYGEIVKNIKILWYKTKKVKIENFWKIEKAEQKITEKTKNEKIRKLLKKLKSGGIWKKTGKWWKSLNVKMVKKKIVMYIWKCCNMLKSSGNLEVEKWRSGENIEKISKNLKNVKEVDFLKTSNNCKTVKDG